ncbi:hypothetical protein NDU88_003557 [Pleurodeles waltl]|uniref:Uncharacterized protein n=1 Tax=Pleurodeles waltl TaxID=8319 RepID=A0AAV7L481_PLEWA|nr:hypothetical protein NDU88_003557 [Pleurodeles waltl]
MAPVRGSPVSSPQSNRACGSTPLPSGTPTARRRVPRRSPVIKGHKVSPRPSIPGTPSARVGEGKARPVAQAAPLAAPRPRPSSWAEPCSSRGSGAGWPQPAPRSPEHPGEPRSVGKASRLPPSRPRGNFSGRGGGAQSEMS